MSIRLYASLPFSADPDAAAELEPPVAPEAAHPAPCRWPSSPDCTCGGGS